jgi:hypothetical protein
MEDNVQDRIRLAPILGLAVALLPLAGCVERGDLGRERRTVFLQDAVTNFDHVREFLAVDVPPELPTSAAEDALRQGVYDLSVLDRKAALYHGRHGDGYGFVEELIVDLRADRQEFQRFMVAAQRTLEIDDARTQRLKGVEALEARRKYALVKERRRENDELVHTGLRLMRALLADEHSRLQQLSIDFPDVPLVEAEHIYDDCMDGIITFHAAVDQRDFRGLRGADATSYK